MFIVLIVVVLFLIFIGIPFLIALGELLLIVLLVVSQIWCKSRLTQAPH